MPANGVILPRGATPPRRWPTVLVTVVVVFSLSLTGFAFVRDRQNADAATGSRTNAARDALALATLYRFAQLLDLDASMRLGGVIGLQPIAQHDFQALVVGPLGGTLEIAPHQWSLALNGGWACLTWSRGHGAVGMASTALGVCTDDAPLVSTSGVTAAQFQHAEAMVARAERAAIDAADAAAAMSSTSQGYDPRFSMPALTSRFARLHGVAFRSWATPWGITVATATSAACLQPTATEAQVRVTVGPCS
jgi:hypothetical protein